MQDPTEPDRPEILSGPGDVRLAEKSAGRSARSPGGKSKAKIIVIAAAALVAVLAAGGVGYLLASDTVSAPSATQDGARPAPSQTDPLLQEDDATMGDVTTDAPKDDADGASDTGDALPDDGSMGDAATDDGDTGSTASDRGTGTDGSRGTDTSRGTGKTSDGKKPPTSSPTKQPETPAADDPADGPAGELSGQCAKSGC